MSEQGSIEVLVRGVCVLQGRILLCYGRESGIRYLPGGHVEFRESARDALVREMREESGCNARIGQFLGCCEHFFTQDGKAHAEINLLFAMELVGVTDHEDVVAIEPWIDFEWQPWENLCGIRFEPAILKERLHSWLRKPGGHCVSTQQICRQGFS